MFRPFLFLLSILFLAQICLAQRATYVDDAGETVVVAPTTDDYGNVYSEAISTIVSTATAKAGVKAAAGVSTTLRSTSTAAPASATHSVPAGTILNYSTYQSSVTAELNSMESSAWANFTATATNLNFLSSDSSRRVEGSVVACLLVIALALGICIV
ncbi:hypothetical protein CI109_102583 [Kwoniella shandongensis]|uniref:Uncharacterized protein n=1 Tax=Kwoniella shandongensis TaxID=1734106 RepID=A0A5M6BY78_9TREE|nr:uncharacterized protein CI109_005164 [Kwoniella shandongensis]KAA5526395.1 hypothetical protein CI109_005164 [Kwoniella shandongensis]